MKAITVRYLGPTDTKPARLRAFDRDGNSVTVSRHADVISDLDGEPMFKAAAIKLCAKMGWSQDLLGGGVKGGYVFVFAKQ